MDDNAINLYNDGYCYYTGTDGYPLNYKKAFECFQEAAKSGNSSSMNCLGLLYEGGKYVQKDYKQAVDWFYKAIQADAKNAHATYNLGRMYYNGLGVEKNLQKAFDFCRSAVMLGLGNTHSAYPQSCYLTGCILLEYFKNERDAYPHFVDAAKYGNIPSAWYNLGWLSEKGVVPLHDPGDDPKTARDAMAKGFYLEAAKLGDADAMDAVGRLYMAHNMLNEARKWIEKSASLGCETAKKRLKMLNIAQGGSLWGLFK